MTCREFIRMNLMEQLLNGLLMLVCVRAGYINGEDNSGITHTQRQSKLFNLQLLPFVTINIDPTTCTADSGGNGTCYSKAECLSKGGFESGSCASGYGVCCVFEHGCGSVVTHNQTYLINDGYPTAFDNVGNCQYIIEKMNPNICQLRLDLETMNLAGPSNSSMCEEDTFTVVGTAGENPRVICGDNSGQHMYLDLASGTSTARVNIATTTTGKNRSWRIRVSQIECNSIYKAPPHCLQYYTAYSGTIKSFNYQTEAGVHQIGGQSYTACVKTREGFCGITYKSDSFSVSGKASEEKAESGDAVCPADFVSIFTLAKTNTVGEDRYCGSAFIDTTTYAKPFQIRVISDEEEPDTDEDNRGFEMKYMQIPC